MKKGVWLATAAAAALGLGLLTACQPKPAAEISVKSGTYVLQDGKVYSDKEGYLALDLSVKNTSGKSMSSIYNGNFTLYDSKNNQIKAESIYAPDDSKFQTLQSSTISPDKTLKAKVVYQVDKGKKYTLHFNPSPYDKKSKDVKVKVNTSKFKDPAKSLTSMAKDYINAVFLGQKNISSPLKNDLTKSQSDFQSAFVKNLTDSMSSYYTPAQGEVLPILTAIENANVQKGKVDYTIDAMYPDYAVVYIRPQTVDLNNLDIEGTMTKWENANQGKFDDYNAAEKAAFKYILQQLPDLIKGVAPSTPKYMDKNGYKLILKKNDGKWSVDDSTLDSGNYNFGDLQEVFSGGSDYSY